MSRTGFLETDNIGNAGISLPLFLSLGSRNINEKEKRRGRKKKVN